MVFTTIASAKVAKATDDYAGNLYIVAVNPGYSSDAGELIELQKLSGSSLSLAGVSLFYTDTSGAEYTLYEFSDGDEMSGEFLLMRYKKSPDFFNMSYDAAYSSRSLLQKSGILRLEKDGEIFDQVCWGEIDDCAVGKFASGSNKTLVRNLDSLGTAEEFSFISDYAPHFDPENPSLISNDSPVEALPQCENLQFSEILTFYGNSKSEQFIEFFNNGSEQILLNGCTIRYKNKTYPLTGVVKPNEYFVRYIEDFALTKNPTSQNKLELLDADGSVVDTLIYYNGQKKSVAYAQFGYDETGKEIWQQTYNPTPGEENVYQKWKTCPTGKVINEETGNCVRDNSIDDTLEACPAGKYRNPLTNRCKSYAVNESSELKPCAEGYERNPETNRCRKITKNTGADYALPKGEYEEKSNFIAIWAIVAVVSLGAGYVIYQYRKEIAGLFKKNK